MALRVDRVPLTSRAVVSAGYDAETETLEIEFTSGRLYRYSRVPQGVYDWLLRVPNKGLYVARSITDHYDYVDVTASAVAPQDGDLEALLEASVRGNGEGG
jgi:hypothetical protein